MPAQQRSSWGAITCQAVCARPATSLLAAIALALTIVLSGCAALPFGSPSAQQIYDDALHSTMQGANFTVSGGGSTTLGGLQTFVSFAGNGQIVLAPQAYTMHLTIKMSGQSLSGQVTFDQIAVDGKAYARAQEQFTGLGSAGSDKYGVGASVPLIPSQIANLKTVGQETVDSFKCWHVSGTAIALGSAAASGASGGPAEDVWIRESDSYIVRMQVGALPGVGLPASGSLLGGSGGVTYTLDFGSYNNRVTIAPPPSAQIAS